MEHATGTLSQQAGVGMHVIGALRNWGARKKSYVHGLSIRFKVPD